MTVHEIHPQTMQKHSGECSGWEDSINIDELFVRFQAVYGNKWTSQFPRDANFVAIARAEWAAGLEDLTPEAIKRGFRACRQQCVFPPSIAEFRRYCLPTTQSLGLPSVEEAMQLILSKRALPEPVEAALNTLGRENFRLGEREKIKKLFTQAYQRAIENFKLKTIQKKFCESCARKSNFTLEELRKNEGSK